MRFCTGIPWEPSAGVRWEGPAWAHPQGHRGVQRGGLGASVGQQEPGGGGIQGVQGGMLLGMPPEALWGAKEGSRGSPQG